MLGFRRAWSVTLPPPKQPRHNLVDEINKLGDTVRRKIAEGSQAAQSYSLADRLSPKAETAPSFAGLQARQLGVQFNAPALRRAQDERAASLRQIEPLIKLDPEDQFRVQQLADAFERVGITAPEYSLLAAKKDPRAQEALRQAQQLSDYGLRELLPGVRSGQVSENDAAQRWQSFAAETLGGNVQALGPSSQEAIRALVRGDPMPLIAGVTSSLMPLPKEAFEPLGPTAGPVSRAYNFGTSPLGVASEITMPGATAAGLVGQTVLGTAGEAANVPAPVQIALETVGGVLPASAFSAPGKALLTALRGQAPEIVTQQVDDALRQGVIGADDAQAIRQELAPGAALEQRVVAEAPAPVVMGQAREAAGPSGLREAVPGEAAPPTTIAPEAEPVAATAAPAPAPEPPLAAEMPAPNTIHDPAPPPNVQQRAQPILENLQQEPRAQLRPMGGGGVESLAQPEVQGAPALIPEGKVPSVALWRDLQWAHLDSPNARDPLRRVGESLAGVPVLNRLVRAGAGPAAIARIDPAVRAGVVYRLMEDLQDSELQQVLARFEGDFPFQMVKQGKTEASIMVGDRAVAFGDVAQDVITKGGGKRFGPLLTPEQHQWILDANERVIKPLAQQFEKASGQRVMKIEDYWPRFTVDEHGKVGIRMMIGAKQSPLKTRLYEEMQQGIDNGVPYAHPLDSVRLYARALQKQTRDEILKQVIREDKVGRSMSQAHKDLIAGLRAQLAQAPAGTPEEIASAHQILIRLEKAREAGVRITTPARGEGTAMRLGPGLSQTVMPRETLQKLEDILGPGTRALRGPERLTAVPRFLVTGMADVGHFFLQGLPALFSHPQAWARSVYRSFEGIATPAGFSKWLAESPAAQRAAKYGVLSEKGTEFTAAVQQGGLLQKVPVISGIARGFDAFIEAGKVYWFDALADAAIKAGEPETELYRIGRYVRTALGTTATKSLGVSATQRQVENIGLFSARYTRSIPGFVAYAMGKGVAAQDARLTLAKMMIGAPLITYGLARAAGLSHDEALNRINPRAGSKFLSIPVGGHEYGIGSGWRAYTKFLGDLTVQNNWQFDSWDKAALGNPFVRFLRSRASPVTGTLLDFIQGQDFVGNPVSIQHFMDDPASLLQFGRDRFLPFNVQAVIEARGPWWEKAMVGAVETAGGRTFPMPVREQLQNEFDKRGMAYDPSTAYMVAQNLAAHGDQKMADIVSQMRQSPEQQGLAHVRDDAAQDPILQAAINLIRADKPAPRFADAYRTYEDKIVGAAAYAYRDRPDLKSSLDEYRSVQLQVDPQTGEPDWGTFFQQRAAAMAKLPPEVQDALQNTLRLPEQFQDVEQRFQEAKRSRDQLEAIDPYHGVTAENYRAARDLISAASRYAQEQGMERGRKPTMRVAIAKTALAQGAPAAVRMLALRVNAGNVRRSPQYLAFLREHQDELYPFYPSLYSSRAVLRVVAR